MEDEGSETERAGELGGVGVGALLSLTAHLIHLRLFQANGT